MIATLTGVLKENSTSSLIVEVHGVGFEVMVPASTSDQLPPEGNEIFLHTYLHLREDLLQLFGFATQEEKKLFLFLISLPKVGVRTALEILSTYSVNQFRQIVIDQDIARFTQVPGIGRKTAERMLFELKERLEFLPHRAEERKAAAKQDDLLEDACKGLVYLGVKYPAATRAVQKAVEVLGSQATVEELIREALKYRHEM